jgi:hypothetical protein
MKFLSVILTFVGYMLLYAAVAAGGKFAKNPWQGVLQDAYEVAATEGSGSTSGDSTPSAPAPKTDPLWVAILKATLGF